MPTNLHILAGMPSVLPEDFKTIFRWNESFLERVEAISFFSFATVLAIGMVWGLWNYVARESKRLPRISFGRAASMVLLWGALFVLVLTMISGARELLTPGAWKKKGFTYELNTEPSSRVELENSGSSLDTEPPK